MRLKLRVERNQQGAQPLSGWDSVGFATGPNHQPSAGQHPRLTGKTTQGWAAAHRQETAELLGPRPGPDRRSKCVIPGGHLSQALGGDVRGVRPCSLAFHRMSRGESLGGATSLSQERFCYLLNSPTAAFPLWGLTQGESLVSVTVWQKLIQNLIQ